MRLLDKLTGKNKKPAHEEDWDFYLSNVNDIIGSFYLDLGLRSIAPIEDKKHLGWISVKMNSPKENGLSSNEEFDTLGEIEDDLTPEIEKIDGIYVGRLTTDGNRDFYFYLNNINEIEKATTKVKSKFSNYEFDFGHKENDNWKLYFEFIYPEPYQLQEMGNRRVVENLEELGDNLTTKRVVFHWIYFKTDSDRTKYKEIIIKKGFQVVTENEIENEETPFNLQISREDFIDLNSVNEYSIELWEQANEIQAYYDGWETSVEKE